MDISLFLWWFFLNVLSMIVLAFFSMQEMACVSLNKVRLHYYVSKGMKRAIWINYLLHDPARLFGTTLFGVNLAMMVGSEFARQSFIALGISPDWASIPQVILVIIFAELAPMFAARRYPEHVAMLGAPILYFSAKLMTPLLWCMGLISKLINALVGGRKAESHALLNREDLQRILAEQEEDHVQESDGEELNRITWNIFTLRNKEARQIMRPLKEMPMLSSKATIAQFRELIKTTDSSYALIYHGNFTHIIGFVNARDVLRESDTKRVRDFASSPWFITKNTKIPQILSEFRQSKKNAAIVINEQGAAIGVITLTDLIEEIFGEFRQGIKEQAPQIKSLPIVIDRTFPADKTVGEFNDQFDVVLDTNRDQTLAELMTNILGHAPTMNESVYIDPFELTVSDATLMDIKKIAIKTHVK